MNKLILALLALPLAPSAALAQGITGDAKAGQTIWESNETQCKNCHGRAGEGAFGPDLAGRGLSFAQFKQAVRKPWGVMPAYVDSQLTDQDIANMATWSASLAKKEQPGAWRFEVPANAPAGQAVAINMGCSQCHGVTLNGPRGNLGAINGDFDAFAKLVYDHTDEMPKHRALLDQPPSPRRFMMGNFSRTRLSEGALREIYTWARDDIGFRPPLAGQLSAGVKSAKGVTYKLHVENGGLKDKGLAAEGVTISLILPAGAKVVGTTGAGYQGVHMDNDAKANVAVWNLAKSAPKDEADYSITLSKAGTKDDNLRGNIRWRTPAPKTGPNADVANIAGAPL